MHAPRPGGDSVVSVGRDGPTGLTTDMSIGTRELRALRSEGVDFLEAIQALPGFRDWLPAPPAWRLDGPPVELVIERVPWHEVERANDAPPGPPVGGWAFIKPLADLRAVWKWHADRYDRPFEVDVCVKGRPTRRIRLDGSGNAATWDDVADGLSGDGFFFPASASLRITEEVDEYRTGVQRVAAKLLLGASWAPAAIHDAQQERRPITLPAPDPQCMVTVPKKELQDASTRAVALLGSTHHRMSAERALVLSDALESVSDLLRGGPENRLREERAHTWEPAIASVASMLRGERIADDAKDPRARAKRYLDAAVTGVLVQRRRGC